MKVDNFCDECGANGSHLADCPVGFSGVKYDGGKTRWDLFPPIALEDIGKVLTFGAKKYAPDNWRKVPDWRRRYFAAAMRHLWAYWREEKNDPETGLPHLAHAGCCVLFLLEMELDDE